MDSVPVSGMLLERLQGLGLDVERVLALASVPRSRFSGVKTRVTTAEFFALWHAIELVAGDRELGLRLGSSSAPHQYDVVSMAALHAPTLGEALRKIARYKRVTCPEQVTIEITRGEARIRYEWLLAAAAPPDFLIDATFTATLALAQRGTQQKIEPRRIELVRARRDEALLARYFACEIRFDAPHDLLVLSEAALATPFVTHNSELVALMTPQLELALQEQARERSFLDDVRLALARNLSGERPSVDKIAKELGVSTRTLQRRLEGAGATYQGLLDSVRRESARRLLAKPEIEPEEVAFLLGFEELNSFTRAFQGWEGVTPRQWRGAERARH